MGTTNTDPFDDYDDIEMDYDYAEWQEYEDYEPSPYDGTYSED